MTKLALAAQKRTILGKKSKTLRHQSMVPAVLFGPKRESESIVIDAKELAKVYKEAGSTSLIELSIDGAKPVLTLVKEMQLNPVTQKIIHASIYEIDATRKLTVEVPIKLVGESIAVKRNIGFLTSLMSTVTVRCNPHDLPQHFEIDISSLNEIGDSILVSDIALPEGVELHSNVIPTSPVLLIQAPQKQEVETEQASETAEGDAESKEESSDENKSESAE